MHLTSLSTARCRDCHYDIDGRIRIIKFPSTRPEQLFDSRLITDRSEYLRVNGEFSRVCRRDQKDFHRRRQSNLHPSATVTIPATVV